MLAKGGITDQRLLRDVHQRMAANYQALGQFANAVESLRKALAIEATAEAQSALIGLLERGPRDARPRSRPPSAVPARSTRSARTATSARPVSPEPTRTPTTRRKALAAYKALLPLDPAALEAARRVVQLNGDEPAKVAETERLLLDAIQKCPRRADYVTYVLATEVYDPRMKDRAKARQVAPRTGC